MVENISIRHWLVGEFTSGLSAGGEMSGHLPVVDDEPPEMRISPDLAADFELGLESEIGSSRGCGCGCSCSGKGGDCPADSGSGCHHHG